MLKLILFVLPLGLDTFAVSAVLGLSGLPRRERLRVSLLLSAFEMSMPVVGLLLGHALGRLLGGAATYTAVAILIGLGAWMLFQGEDAEEAKVASLAAGRGLTLLALGLSISLDELAMGFTIGLLHLSLWLAIVLIGAQAFLLAQLGLRLGSRISGRMREGAERLSALALIGLGLLFLLERLAGST